MKKTLLAVLACSLVLSACSQAMEQKLDEYMLAANKYGGFNGSVLVAKDGKILLEKGYGIRNAATNTSHDENSVFQIGSVTKQFTAALILKLQQQGKLSVKDKLSKYFPQYKYADKITIENLLTHTSGIYNYTNDTGFMKNHVTENLSQAGFWNMIKDKPLDFDPGTKFSYSNSGFLILGYIIEKVAGQPYESFARKIIFVPADMRHSGFDFTHLQSNNKSIGYFVLSKETALPSPIVDSTVAFSAGAIYSTVHDLYNWNTALNTSKIIPANLLEMAYTPNKEKYGYGFSIDTMVQKRIIQHGGGIHGFTSFLYSIPEDKVCVVLLSNNSGDVSKPGKDLLAILYNQPYQPAKEEKEFKVDTAILRQYVGEYELAPSFKITITQQNGSLIAQATGQPALELFAKDQNNFFLKVVDAQVEFVKNAEGKTESLILHQNGQNMPGKKVK